MDSNSLPGEEGRPQQQRPVVDATSKKSVIPTFKIVYNKLLFCS
jgi:hypothetical protein